MQIRRFKRWSHVGLCVGFIYSTLYIARPICEFLKQKTPFNIAINLSMLLLLVSIVVIFFKRVNIRRKSTCFLFLFGIGMYLIGLIWLQIPEEKVHFVEYGFLAFLVYKAVISDWKNPQSYLIACIITSLFGWGDEGIQYLLPNRYYQWQDVVLNAVSGGLGLYLTYVMGRDKKDF